MKQKILNNLNNPSILEQLYQENKVDFTKNFKEIELENDSELIAFWKIRLAANPMPDSKKINRMDLTIIGILALFTGVLIKLPDFFSQIARELFYQRNLAILVFNALILFVFWQRKIIDKKSGLAYGFTLAALACYMNFLPIAQSDSVMLAMLHVPILLVCFFGLTFISFDYTNTMKRIAFIRFMGEYISMTGLLLIATGMLTGITFGLFSAIKINIETFYLQYIVVFGGVALPMFSFYLIQLYPTITNKIAPVIATVFTPIIFITLFIYLISFVFSNGLMVEEREVLMLFNVMLVAVLAVIVFSVSELQTDRIKNPKVLMLFLLAVLAILINAMALFAIVTRISEGLTPNRTVVFISNVLLFVNLLLLAKSLFQTYWQNKAIAHLEKMVANYLTVYLTWVLLVIFLLPLLFGWK